MLNLSDFMALSVAERISYVDNFGALIARDLVALSRFYTVGDFYAEVKPNFGGETVEVHGFRIGERFERMMRDLSPPKVDV